MLKTDRSLYYELEYFVLLVISYNMCSTFRVSIVVKSFFSSTIRSSNLLLVIRSN